MVFGQLVCDRLSISSNLSEQKNDVVYQGQVLNQWTQNSSDPILTNQGFEFDYFYVNIVDIPQKLTQKDVQVQFDDHNYADSKVVLAHKREISKNVNQYSIQVNYRCKQYGGALINYQLDLNIPGCGQTSIFWKKICGNPLTYRYGLQMDMEIGKYNHTILKDGVLQNANYFDSEIDDFVFKIPAKQQSLNFYIYMQVDSDKNKQNDQKVPDEQQDEYSLLKEIMRLIPEELIETIEIEGDDIITQPSLVSELMNGGIINERKQKIQIIFNCISEGDSLIEINIPLTYFRDVNLNILKECKNKYIVGKSKGFGFFNMVLIWTIIGCFLTSIYNVLFKDKFGVDAVPFLRKILQKVVQIEFIKKNPSIYQLINNLLQYKNNKYSNNSAYSYKNINTQNEISLQEIETVVDSENQKLNISNYGSLQ